MISYDSSAAIAPIVAPPVMRPAETTLQALLFSEIFKPLAKDLGPVGEVAVATVAQQLALRSRA